MKEAGKDGRALRPEQGRRSLAGEKKKEHRRTGNNQGTGEPTCEKRGVSPEY